MIIRELSARNIVFTHEGLTEWNLHLHLIRGEKNTFLIDSGLGSSSVEPVLEYLRGDSEPLVVINTHHHWDHVWGNGALPASVIIAHTLCYDILSREWERMLEKNRRYMFGTVEKRLPTLLFDKEIYFPEDQVRLFYTPGHTVDSISVFDEKEKVLNVGDNVGDTVDEIVPELDCEKKTYLNTIKLYKGLDFRVCVSGHNEVLGKDFTKKILHRFKADKSAGAAI